MNKFMIKLIRGYQESTKHSHKTCKYTPTCSEYAIDAYSNYNFFRASFMVFFRILRCNIFSKGGYDPIPKYREEKFK